MRRIAALLSLVALLVIIGATPIFAATSVDIGLVATPLVGEGIANFTITWVSDKQLDLSWDLVGGATQIMIRSKRGGYPDDIPDIYTAPSDGDLVYYGEGNFYSDTSVDFDANFETDFGIVYYAAWAQRADGTWFTETVTGSKESVRVFQIMLGGIAAILMIAGYAVHSHGRILLILSAGFWLAFGAYNYTLSEEPWDISYFLFWLGMFAGTFGGFLGAALMRERKKDVADELIQEAMGESDADRFEREYDELTAGTQIPRVGHRHSRARRSGQQRNNKPTQNSKGPQY